MSNSTLFNLYDPKHGKVGDICKGLGYASDRKSRPRSTYSLSSKVSIFRKKFLDATPKIDIFPLEYQSEEAQQCASNFLTENSHLFDYSEEAEALSWPTYPRDNQKLIENLAKLMCTQEFTYRRNANYVESLRRKRTLEENEDSIPDGSDGQHFEAVESSSSPTTSVDSNHEEKDAIPRERVLVDIDLHLDFAYPLDGSEDDTSRVWVFDSQKWPKDAKRFAFRYLHEHNLYSTRKGNLDAVMLFAENLGRHLDVGDREGGIFQVQRRCCRQITYRAGIWHGHGFLVTKGGLVRKTAQFEAAWRARRQQWINLGSPGDLNGAIDPLRNLLSGSETGPDGNKDCVCTELIHDLPPQNASTGSVAKRTRVKGFYDPSSRPHNTSEEDHSFGKGHRRRENISLEAEANREPRRVSEASMLTPVAAGPQRSVNAVQEEDEPDNNATCQSSSSTRRHLITKPFLPSPQPDNQSARSRTTLEESLDTHPLLEKRTSPYALSGSFLSLPFNADTTMVKSTQVTRQGEPHKPILNYILPSARGGLDHEDPLPRETFRACNISEFFNIVAARAGKSDRSLTCLTFTYNWGERESFTISKFVGDQYWEEVKERVKGKFLKTRNATKRMTRFELWVECGDTTNLDEVEEDDW